MTRRNRERARLFGQMVIDQFVADIEIWSHQRYQATPALALPNTRASWIPHLGPSSIPRVEAYEQNSRLPGRHRQRRHRDDQTHRPPSDLELAGLHCYTPEKIGATPEIAGVGPIGVTATGTVEEIIAAHPDVVTFHGVFPDEDLYVKVLEAGIDIVTTADWITGWHRDTNHPHPSGKPVTQLLQEACERAVPRSTAPE